MSREKVLGRIRAALSADPADLERRSAVAARLADPPRHPTPARSLLPAPERADLFKAALAAQGADLIAVARREEIPAAIAAYLGKHGLPPRIRLGADPYLAALDWERAPLLAVETGPAQAGDGAGLSRAVAGVAETGTLVLASGPDNPVTLAFVPDTHLAVVEALTIMGSYEDAMVCVAQARGPSALPRTLNLVSGPSRTGDIGGKIVKGAHGPRRLAIILVGPDQDESP
jgi:L-lactate dehydrogenase complex protein LldG